METPVQVSGKWLVDRSGRVFIPHGENIAHKRPPYLPSAAGFNADDAQLLAREGFDAVRITLFWAAIEPAPGVYDDEYLADIARTVTVLNQYGVTTLLEMHQDIWSAKYGGDGAPDWATIDDGLPDGAHDLVGANLSNVAFWRATDNFYENRVATDGVGIRDRFLAMWRHVAAYFAGTAGVIGYGPLNQPPTGAAFLACLANACPPLQIDRLRAFTRDVTAAIRQGDPRTPIWLAPLITSNYGARPDLGSVPDRNVVYGYNSYCVVAALQGGGGAGCEPQWQAGAAEADRYSDQQQVPAVVTEFGATGAADALSANAAIFDAYRNGWFHWTYLGGDPATVAHDSDAQAIVIDASKPRSGDNVRESNLDALARPYPQLTAGTPGPWSFAIGTKEFDYSWSPARATGGGRFPAGSETVVAVPQRQYREGYHVRIGGGRRVSDPGALQLRIASCDDSGPITLAVLPGLGADEQGC
ncbi:cellulase family glycosylhydrolase [Nocardia sp. NPDC051570]|uniref:cellulase family glycosylhydrolase n=1 Tax=Nocardia sp. NPDC051570 TaxID=3364324 RepID=UPI0037B6D36E